jgi:XisI protein
MDKIKKYEKHILSVLEPYAQIKYSNLDAQNQLIADRKNHRYQIVTIGRDRKGRYIHDTPIHLDIVNGKIWIQWNMTEIDFGRELTDRGVPKSDIVIGFLAPEIREYSDYAVA